MNKKANNTWDAHGLEKAVVELHEKLISSFPNYSSKTYRKFELIGMCQCLFNKLDEMYAGSLTYDDFWKNALVPHILWTCVYYTQDCLNDKDFVRRWKSEDEAQRKLSAFKSYLFECIKKTCPT